MSRAAASLPATIEVEVAFSPRPGEVLRRSLRLPRGATVADAVARCGWTLPDGVSAGVWGRVRSAETMLQDRDRVELWRGLAVDPKEARRLRYVGKQRVRG